MNRKLNKLFVTSLTILTASLIAIYLIERIDVYFKNGRSYQSVLAGMTLMVIVYYPMTTFLEKYFEVISKKMLSNSKKIAKSNTLGMLIGFSIAIFVLFIFYAQIWYGIDVIKDIKKGIGL